AADVAAVLTERGLGGDDVDLTHRVENFRRDRSRRAGDARAMARRWAELAGGDGEGSDTSIGAILSLAYPDRIAKNRGKGAFALAEQTRKVEPNDETARLLTEGIARVGVGELPWTKALTQWRDRVIFLRRAEGDEWPDLSDSALAANIDWLTALFPGKTAVSDV